MPVVPGSAGKLDRALIAKAPPAAMVAEGSWWEAVLWDGGGLPHLRVHASSHAANRPRVDSRAMT